jgi:Rrf2 family protein
LFRIKLRNLPVVFKKETEYALRGMVYIQLQNLKDRRPGVAEIAQEIEAPFFYTAKIFQRLVKIGFVRSLKGKGGGFFLDQAKKDLPLKELIIAIEGDELFVGCGFGLKNCDESNPCPLHYRYAFIRDEINRLVYTETIQSLAQITLTKTLALGFSREGADLKSKNEDWEFNTLDGIVK